MKRLIALLAVIFLVAGVPTAYAGGWWKSSQHPYDDDGSAPLGVGADVLIHEVKDADIVAEYRYDTENDVHALFAVVKTRKSLVDYLKDALNKEE